MDDVFAGILVALIVIFAWLGVVFVISGSFDATIVRQCDKDGYWQTGQIRVLCSVEDRK